MTLIIGIKCQDGVVMAADSAATFGNEQFMTIGQQEVTKIRVLAGQLLFSSTGAVGISQLIGAAIDRKWKGNGYKGCLNSAEEAMRAVGISIVEEVQPFLQSANMTRPLIGNANSSLCKCLVALPIKGQGHLFQFDYNGAPESATEELPFIALGSGQAIADPFLAFLKRVFWEETKPSLSEGRLVATWAIEHVKRTNPGGVGGAMQLATLDTSSKNTKPTLLSIDHREEHLQQIEALEAALLREIRGATQPENSVSSPPTRLQ